MTQPNETPQPVFGIDDSLEEMLGGLTVDAGDLSEGLLSDIYCTLVGITTVAGGEEKMRGNNPNDTYITPDQLVLWLRVDNADDLGLDDPYARQFISLPAKNKQGLRQRPTTSSNYGMWLMAWEALGISASPDAAHVFQFKNVPDLLGIKFHREVQKIQGFGGREMTVHLPTEFLGFDNEIRKKAKLPDGPATPEEAIAAA